MYVCLYVSIVVTVWLTIWLIDIQVAARQKRRLVQPRDFQDNKNEEFLIRFVYTSEDLLEAIIGKLSDMFKHHSLISQPFQRVYVCMYAYRDH